MWARGFFTFSPNNGRTGAHACVCCFGNYLPSGGDLQVAGASSTAVRHQII